MNEIKFNNIPNEKISIAYHRNDGSKFHTSAWVSRSLAVTGLVVFNDNVLVVKRSINMYTEPGKLCLPCGYIDWNESGYDAMVREVYEETSLYLPDYESYLIHNNDKNPVYVESRPEMDKNQNISLIYLSYYNIAGNELPNITDFKCSETSKVFWMKFNDVINHMEYPSNAWAFNHDKIVKHGDKYLQNKLNNIMYE